MITDSFSVLCLTETWLKSNDYFVLNESTPPRYCYKQMSPQNMFQYVQLPSAI